MESDPPSTRDRSALQCRRGGRPGVYIQPGGQAKAHACLQSGRVSAVQARDKGSLLRRLLTDADGKGDRALQSFFGAGQHPPQSGVAFTSNDAPGAVTGPHECYVAFGVLTNLEGAHLDGEEVRDERLRHADHFDSDRRDAGSEQVDSPRRRPGEVDDPPIHERPTVGDANLYRSSIPEIDHTDPRPER